MVDCAAAPTRKEEGTPDPNRLDQRTPKRHLVGRRLATTLAICHQNSFCSPIRSVYKIIVSMLVVQAAIERAGVEINIGF
jgi:hypothetical protein